MPPLLRNQIEADALAIRRVLGEQPPISSRSPKCSGGLELFWQAF